MPRRAAPPHRHVEVGGGWGRGDEGNLFRRFGFILEVTVGRAPTRDGTAVLTESMYVCRVCDCPILKDVCGGGVNGRYTPF